MTAKFALHTVQRIEVKDDDEWPETISDGLMSRCWRCGRHPNVDFSVTDYAWEITVPERHRQDVMCLECFLDDFPSSVLPIGDAMMVVQVVRGGETVYMVPAAVYQYGGP